MELRQLEYFRQIADTHSFNEAARHLNMSQPPLSYQIHQLEEELGVQLFDHLEVKNHNACMFEVCYFDFYAESPRNYR